MHTLRNILVIYSMCSFGVHSRPVISSSGVVNAASYHPGVLDSGSLAPGVMFTLFGSELGPAEPVAAGGYPLRPELGGVRVAVVNASGTFDCPLLYVSSRQVNAILPSAVGEGPARMSVVRLGESSESTPFRVVSSQAGIFSWNGQGTGTGVITDVAFRPIWVGAPAKPGQTVIVWLTGLGASLETRGDFEPQSFPLNPPISVFVGDQAAKVIYKYRSGCCVGLDQVAFEVPSVSGDCATPLHIRTSAGIYSNFVTIPIATSGDCQVQGKDLLSLAQNADGFELGTFLLARSGTQSVVEDAAAVVFQRFQGAEALAFSSPSRFPPAGSCSVYARSPVREFPVQNAARTLNAGASLQLLSGSKDVRLFRFASGVYGADGIESGSEFYDQPSVLIRSSGTVEVPVFSNSATSPQGLFWEVPQTIRRDRDLEVTWNPTSNSDNLAVLRLSAEGELSNGGATTPYSVNLYCTEKAGKGKMAVPSDLLRQIPAGATVTTAVTGFQKIATESGAPGSLPVVILSERTWRQFIQVR